MGGPRMVPEFITPSGFQSGLCGLPALSISSLDELVSMSSDSRILFVDTVQFYALTFYNFRILLERILLNNVIFYIF